MTTKKRTAMNGGEQNHPEEEVNARLLALSEEISEEPDLAAYAILGEFDFI